MNLSAYVGGMQPSLHMEHIVNRFKQVLVRIRSVRRLDFCILAFGKWAVSGGRMFASLPLASGQCLAAACLPTWPSASGQGSA